MELFNPKNPYIFLRIVQSCNLNCKHCFTLGNKDVFKLSPLENIDSFLQLLKEKINPVSPYIYIHGGEPYLAGIEYLNKVADITDKYFPSKRLTMQTNLTYKITDDFISFVKNRCGSTLGVSWDKDIRFKNKNQEDLFFKNLEILKSNNINYYVHVTIQKHLLEMDPVEFVKQFEGATSIDFEVLSTFDKQTEALKPSNAEWDSFYFEIVKYYLKNKTSWGLPRVEVFQENIKNSSYFDCRCNCCADGTFSLNVNGTIGLCPDTSYQSAISNIKEAQENWGALEKRAIDYISKRKILDIREECLSCDLYKYCGGNAEPETFDNSGECIFGRKALRYQLENYNEFEERIWKK